MIRLALTSVLFNVFISLSFAQNIEIVDFCANEPEYPGGEIELHKFIFDNIDLSNVDVKHGKEFSQVFVQFTVQQDGSISDIQIIKGGSESLNREIIRVITLMPKWFPAEKNGEAFNYKFILPIRICLG